MSLTIWKPAATGALALALLAAAAAPLHAQSTTTTAKSPWSVEGSIGWDNGISGNINSSGIGTLGGQTVVIKSNTYEEVYGTGLHVRGGAAYALSDRTEVTGIFTFQSLDADQVVPMGDIGLSKLYGQFTDYQSVSLDAGLRRYLGLTQSIRLYGEGTLGIGFIDETDVTLVAPTVNLTGVATDFYDQTVAWAAGANIGVMMNTASPISYFGQLGLRWMTGMSEVDNLQGTGLEDINNKSSRWTLPFVAGLRLRF